MDISRLYRYRVVLYPLLIFSVWLLPSLMMQVEWKGISGTLPRYWQTYEWTGYLGAAVLAIVYSIEASQRRPQTLGAHLMLALPFLSILPVLYQYAEYPVRSWDYDCYQIAGDQILAGENPYSGFYIYPPLLAWAIARLQVALNSAEWVFFTYQYLQLLWVAAMVFQLKALLRKMAVEDLSAALILGGVLIFNIPLWRTIHHNQVNLILLNILLFSLLQVQRRPFLSGLLLAIGAHLKIYPTVIAGIWAVGKRWKATSFFLAVVIGLGFLLSFLIPGIWLEFLTFFKNFPGGTAMRDNGLHSILYNLFYITGFNQGLDQGNFQTFIKSLYLFCAALVCLYFLYRYYARRVERMGVGEGLSPARQMWLDAGDVADAGAFMVLFSPMVWEHHFVLTLPLAIFALVLFPRFRTFLAVFLIFGMPVADIFILSLTRITGLVILLYTLSSPLPASLKIPFTKLKPFIPAAGIIGFCLLMISFISRFEHRIFGDGHEYVLQTVAWSEHGYPNLTKENTDHLLNYSRPVFRQEYFRDLMNFQLQTPLPQPPNGWIGFYYSLQDKLIGYHFPFYSLLAVPFKWLLTALGDDWLKAFAILNTLLWFLPLCYLVLFSELPGANKIWLGIFLFFSPMIWYLRWPHTEVLTGSLVALALLLWTDKRYGLSLILIALASLQNQPLLLLMLLPMKDMWFSRHYSIWQKALIPSIACIIGFLPLAFFYHHFGVTNLIVHIGSASARFITPTRIFDFFMDLNQGVVAGFPLMMALFPFFIWQQIRKKEILLSALLILVLLGVAATASMTINWNMGQAGISRYAVWAGMILLIPILALINLSGGWTKIFLSSGLFLQIFILSSFGMTDAHDGHCLSHNAFAKWVLDGNPSCYNPEMETFQERSLGREGVLKDEMRQGPLFYIRPDGKATKAIVAANRLDTCDFGSTQNRRLLKRLQQLQFQENGFAYIDLIDLHCYPKAKP